MTDRRVAALAAGILVAAGLVACAPAADDAAPDGELAGTLTVFAAASLSGTFDTLASEFEAQHPSVDVVLNYGGSGALAQQVVAGAPADVIATADEATMRTVTDAGAATAPVVIATNTLELVVPAGNPGAVSGLDDLARPDLIIALCDPVAPCGAAAERLLAAEGVVPAADTLEEDVTAVLTKVRLGEADAGLVYVTDVRTAGDAVLGIALGGTEQIANRYQAAALTDAPHPAAAAAWLALLTGDTGQALLREAGFGAP